MKRIAAVAALAVLTLGVLGSAQASSKRTTAFVIDVTMTGAQEAPGPGDPDGIGHATLTFKPRAGQVCFVLTASRIILPAIGAHIHVAPVGQPGPIVVPLTPPDANGGSHGCVAADPALIKAIIHHPDQYYVNVHTTDFPAGAIRGQLA